MSKSYIETFISLTSPDNFFLTSQHPVYPRYTTLKTKPFFPQKLKYIKNREKIRNEYFDPDFKTKNNYMREILNNRMTAFQHCLSKANCQWLMNIMDDAYVHIPRLKDFLDDLGSQYDPLKDTVIKGNCMYFSGKDVYLQGGSGYILSRQALQLIFDNFNEKLLVIDFADDALITNIFMQAGLTLPESDSGRFLGTRPDISNTNDWEKQLPECTKPSCNLCAGYNYPASKVVVFHPFVEGELAEKMLRLVNASSSVFIDMSSPVSHVCKKYKL